MSEKKEFLIETDLMIEHLTIKDGSVKSGLEIAMEIGICFTTAVNASELFFAAKTEVKQDSVKKILTALKVLGISARYSLNINEFAGKVSTVRDAIICATAKINKLPILTNNPEKYKLTGLKILHPKDLRG